MAKAITKQDIRRNPLAEWVVAGVRFTQARRTIVVAALAAVVLGAGVGSGYWWYAGRRQDEASRALFEAHTAVRADQPGTPGNPEEAMRRYREVAQRYRGTRAAAEALIRLGNIQMENGKVDEAIRTFGEYLTTYPQGRFLVMAALGKAYAQEAKGDLHGVVQTLSQILDREKDDPLVGEAYIALARVYESLNSPDDAMRTYGQVVERFGQTNWAQYALQRMGSIKTK